MVRGILLFVAAAGLSARTSLAALIPVSQTLHATASARFFQETTSNNPPDVIVGAVYGMNQNAASASLDGGFVFANVSVSTDVESAFINLKCAASESSLTDVQDSSSRTTGTISFSTASPTLVRLDQALHVSKASVNLNLFDHPSSSLIAHYSFRNRTPETFPPEVISDVLSLGSGQFDIQFDFSPSRIFGQAAAGSYDATLSVIPEPGTAAMAMISAAAIFARRPPTTRP